MNYRESLLKLNLQFFADEGGDKTEEATPKKLEDARKEGQVARSTELVTAVALLALFGGLKLFISFIGTNLLDGFKEIYSTIDTYSAEIFTTNYAQAYINKSIGRILLTCLPLFGVAVLFVVAINIYQVKWKPTAKPLKPKFSKLNPISGFKRIFSKDKLVELVKAVLKIVLIL